MMAVGLCAAALTATGCDGQAVAPDASATDDSAASVLDAATADASLTDAAPAVCGSNHQKVGWVADLSTLQHGVKGRITVTDNCTLTVTNFSYDGRGLDVLFYGALSTTTFSTGFAIGPQLLRSQPYVNETLVIKLPADRTLDSLTSLSVWCVDVGVSFGHGSLRAP
jgi:Electron transfer DM13